MADCCDWSGKSIFKSSAASVGLLRVPNIAALRALQVSGNDNGLLVLIETLHDAFEFQASLSGADDGITQVAPGSGSGLWTRLNWRNEAWARQESWFVHPTAGNDENSGATQGLALRTHAELRRRLNGQVIQQTVTVTILADLDENIELSIAPKTIADRLLYRGVPSAVTSGTVDVFTQFDSSELAQTATTLTAVGVSDWTPFVDKRIRFTSGPAAGRMAWIAKAIGSQARLSALPSGSLPPVSGNTYVIEDLNWVKGISLEAACSWALTASIEISDLQLGDPTNGSGSNGLTLRTGSAIGLVANCRANSLLVNCERATFQNCAYFGNSAGNTFTASNITLRAGLAKGVVNAHAPARLTLSGHLLLQWFGSPPVLNFMTAAVFIEEGVAAFDHNGEILPVQAPGSVRASGPIWGQDNTGVVVRLDSCCSYVYTVKPRALTSGTELMIGGTAKTYAAVPFFNVDNGAAMVNNT